jgi:hypothetical protein
MAISITDGKVHDVNILDEILPQAGAFYVMDRGYVDFQRLYTFTLSAAFFVVRTKSNVLLQRRYSSPVDEGRPRSSPLRDGLYSLSNWYKLSVRSVLNEADLGPVIL